MNDLLFLKSKSTFAHLVNVEATVQLYSHTGINKRVKWAWKRIFSHLIKLPVAFKIRQSMEIKLL